MKRSVLLGVLAIAIAVSIARQSQADQILDFTFSFQNEPGVGNVAGTVSGNIVLDVLPSGSATATALTIDSLPSGLSLIGSPPIDVTQWSVQISNEFTVSNGLVTAGWFDADSYSHSVHAVFELNYGYAVYGGVIGGVNSAEYAVVGADYAVANVDGLAGANIDPSPTPEPASITMLVSGFFAAGGFGLYRRRRGRSESGTAC
jgi:hypothetical protein